MHVKNNYAYQKGDKYQSIPLTKTKDVINKKNRCINIKNNKKIKLWKWNKERKSTYHYDSYLLSYATVRIIIPPSAIVSHLNILFSVLRKKTTDGFNAKHKQVLLITALSTQPLNEWASYPWLSILVNHLK